MRFSSAAIFVIFLAGSMGCDVPELEQPGQPAAVESPASEAPPASESPSASEAPTAETPTAEEAVDAAPSSPAAPEPDSSSSSDKEGSDKEVSLDGVISSWRASQEDEALQQLLAVKDSSFAENSLLPVFQLSEEEFKGVSRADANSIQGDLGDIVRVLRGLSRKCLALADEALEQGDFDKSRKHFKALGLLGEAMTKPRRLTAIKMIGANFVKSSKEGLSRCEEAERAAAK